MRGITFLEVLIIIIIIGILATLAIPNFERAREMALKREAIANLRLIAAAERIYRLRTGTFYSSADIDTINTTLKLQLNEDNWDCSIVATANTFTATADRQGGGGFLDCQYTINESQDEPSPNASCP
ncbi:MAG: hypothetical protein NC916_01485 [Candidatus Omnitrophica bacterium]|nr:hypothetical protein [Candidatus Omnitrophota bacterium]